MSEQELGERVKYAQARGWELRTKKGAHLSGYEVSLLSPNPKQNQSYTSMHLPIEYSIADAWRAFGSSLPSVPTASQQNGVPRPKRGG